MLSVGSGFYNLPSWPYPVVYTGFTDDLTFLQRLYLAPYRVVVDAYFESRYYWSESLCDESTQYSYQIYWALKGYFPKIYSTVMGLVYPRPLLPMMHFVGALTVETNESLPSTLENWLASKPNKSVIYISMGSVQRVTETMGAAIINGIVQTNYSVVWSLRESNRDVLKGF